PFNVPTSGPCNSDFRTQKGTYREKATARQETKELSPRSVAEICTGPSSSITDRGGRLTQCQPGGSSKLRLRTSPMCAGVGMKVRSYRQRPPPRGVRSRGTSHTTDSVV